MSFPAVSWIASYGADRPSFSRDGTRVVYQSLIDGGLYILELGSGVPWLLLPSSRDLLPSRPDWSWSPETIAFGAVANGRSTIWLIDSDGSNLRQVPGMGNLSHSVYPSWYQDLEHIAVLDAKDPEHMAVWRLTVNGREDPHRLTTTHDFCAGRPSVAPGDALAPVALAGTQGTYDQKNNQIWIATPPSQDPAPMDAEQGRSPNWSPDGKWILFESNRGTLSSTGNYQIFVAPRPVPGVQSAAPVALTDPQIFAQHAEWSRQQDRIVFERGSGEALGVFEVPPAYRFSHVG